MMCVVVRSSGTRLLRNIQSSVDNQRDPVLSTTAGTSSIMLTLTKKSSIRYILCLVAHVVCAIIILCSVHF